MGNFFTTVRAFKFFDYLSENMQESVLDSPETEPPYPGRRSQIPTERPPVLQQLPIFDFRRQNVQDDRAFQIKAR